MLGRRRGYRQRAEAAEGALRELDEGMRSLRTDHEEIQQAVRSIVGVLPPLCVSVFACGGAFAWSIAAIVGDDLPVWPSIAASLLGIPFAFAGVLMLNRPGDWSRNVAVLRDNVLVILLSTALAVVVSFVFLVLD